MVAILSANNNKFKIFRVVLAYLHSFFFQQKAKNWKKMLFETQRPTQLRCKQLNSLTAQSQIVVWKLES